MDLTLSHLAAAGVWASLLPVGAMLLRMAGIGLESASRTSRALAQVATGVLAWSLVLLCLAWSSRFSPAGAGWVGWAVVAAWLFYRRARPAGPARSAGRTGIWIAALLLLGAAVLHGGWPKESLFAERDEGIYTLHALHLLRTGENRIDMQAVGLADSAVAAAMAKEKALEFPGIYPTGTRWTFQFSALPSLWMAQMAATFGDAGLFRVNVLFSLLSGLALLSLLRELLPGRAGPWPLVVLAAFLLNPAQVWVARVNLSEPLAQWFTLSGLLLTVLAFRDRNQRTGLLAGLVLGGAALVRIDALLTLLLLLAAYPLAWLASGQKRPDGPWAGLAAGATLMTGFGIAYFALDVAPYWNDHASFLLPLLLVSLPLLVIAALIAPGRLPPFPAGFARAALAGVGVLLVALFLYAAIVRPWLANPALINSPLVPSLLGQRDYRELSLVNLAAYLGWPLLVAALAGYVLQLRSLATPGTAIVLSVLLGCSAAFLWNPMVSPDHVWASRRFIPVVMPGALLMAGLALALASRAWPDRLRQGVAVLLAVALAGQMTWTQRSTVFFAEEKGLLTALRALDEQLPANAGLLLVDGSTLAAVLLAGFGRPALPAINGSFDQAVAVHQDLARCAAERPCVAVHVPGVLFPGLSTHDLGAVTLLRQRIGGTPRAPATATDSSQVQRQLTRIDGFMPAVDDRLVGEHRDWRLPEHGFWDGEVGTWGSMRWTDGDATVRVPSLPAAAVEFLLQLPKDGGSHLRLSINDEILFEGLGGAGRWQRSFRPPAPGVDGYWNVRIQSSRFTAADRYGGGDQRTLGVKVEAVRLVAAPPSLGKAAAPDYRARLELVSAGAAGGATPRRILLTVRNDGQDTWLPAAEATAEQPPVQLGLLLLDRGAPLGSVRHVEQRVALPHRLAPGEDVLIAVDLDASFSGGAKLPESDYDLVVSPVLEGVAWFHDHGALPLRIPVQASELK